MPTRWLTGHETAEAIEDLVPGSVARSTGVACYLKPEMLVEACHALRDDSDGLDLVHLTNLCAVDYWSHFEVVYHLQSFYKNQFATLKVDVQGRDKPAIPSVVPVWHGAWMQECEAYDLFGIVFEGHPNLHRILLWDGYPGWPLRKDFLSMPGGLQPGLNEFAGTARREAPPVRLVE
ncbi:MAG: NADH-quinone oxidoreductase subunit C [Dehalococcoidia bacterium]|nr:NADH-quinone oxidoreductase subunit C [Dehalococcoidia bacterium]